MVSPLLIGDRISLFGPQRDQFISGKEGGEVNRRQGRGRNRRVGPSGSVPGRSGRGLRSVGQVSTAAGREGAGFVLFPFFRNVQDGSLRTFPPFIADSCARMPTQVILADCTALG